ncbi:MAG TPA: glycosyltransferase family 2 protein [Aggregatilineales bacterium]|nr:glycosyltransferase family 2 protein [Aggregatilineales bacterium]
MTNNPLISIVIPNWNGAHFLPTCLDSLRRQTAPRLEVIVADNASTDGSLELLARDYPEVRVVALPENRGFTGACNAGMRAATGDIVILLNNDTEVEPDWAEQVAAAFERYPDAGIVASKMLLFDRRSSSRCTPPGTSTPSMGGRATGASGSGTTSATTARSMCSARAAARRPTAARCWTRSACWTMISSSRWRTWTSRGGRSLRAGAACMCPAPLCTTTSPRRAAA